MSNQAWADKNSDCSFLKLNDRCPNSNCIYREQSTFTPRKYQLEEFGFKHELPKKCKENKKAWDSFLKPAFNTIAPATGLVSASKTKTSQVGRSATSLKSILGGKNLEPHGNAR